MVYPGEKVGRRKVRKEKKDSVRKSDGDKLGVWCGIAIGKKTP